MSIAALERVSVTRGGRSILRELSLRVEAGERIALIGPNGAGKTTILRLLAGLDTATAGLVTRAPPGLGYVPQAVNESFFPWFSVQQNVAMPGLVAQLPNALETARALLARLVPGVEPLRRAGRLSGGERQAAAIARALVAPGAIVLADEPFSALSSVSRRRAREVMSETLGGRALVLVTHDLADAEALCSRVVQLEDGAIA